jgi:hypothetical protein
MSPIMTCNSIISSFATMSRCSFMPDSGRCFRRRFRSILRTPSPFPRRMDLGFLIFPGQLRLVAQNAEVSVNISVSVIGNTIEGANGFPPRFDAGGTLETNSSGVTTWTNLSGGEDIGLPPDGTQFGNNQHPVAGADAQRFFRTECEGQCSVRYVRHDRRHVWRCICGELRRSAARMA